MDLSRKNSRLVWIEKHIGKHKCHCGCDGVIPIHYWTKSVGIKKYLPYHDPKWKEEKYESRRLKIKRKCSLCKKIIIIRTRQQAENKNVFCSNEHNLMFKETNKHKEECRNNLLRNKHKLFTEKIRNVVRDKCIEKLKNGNYKPISKLFSVDLKRAHKCRFEGCDRIAFSVWDYCRSHMKGSEEETNIQKASHVFQQKSIFKNMSLKGLPLELRLTAYLWAKIKGDLNGYRDHQERSQVART